MRVAVITKSWRSGSGWFASELARAIAAQNSGTLLICPAFEPASLEATDGSLERLMPPRELDEGGKIRRKLVSLSRTLMNCFYVLKSAFRYDAFIFTIPEPLPFVLPVFAILRLLGKPVLFVVHDPTPHAWSYPASLRWLEEGLLKLSYRLPTALVPLTKVARKALIERYAIAPEKITVIPHGLYLMGGETHDITGNHNLLVFGMLRRNKNIRSVIEAVLRLRQQGQTLTLTIAGEPHREDLAYWEDCKKLIESDPAGFNIIPRFITDEEVKDLLAKADALLLPYENFDSQSGVGVLAAINLRPIIATRVGGLTELFELGAAGVPIDGKATPEAVAGAISTFLAKDAATWNSECLAARDTLTEALSWETIARSYLALAREKSGKS